MKLSDKLLLHIHGLMVLNRDREHNRLDAFVDHRQLVEAINAVVRASKEDKGREEQLRALQTFSGVMASFGTRRHRGVVEALEHLHPMRRCLQALVSEANKLSKDTDLSESIRNTLGGIAVCAAGAYRRLTARGAAVEAALRLRI